MGGIYRMVNDMEERINNILSNYRNIVKPLLVDIKARRADRELPDNFLNEIRALNDHIARCYRNEVSDIDAELTKAEGHLRRLIYDCFKQLNIYINDILERKENKFYSDLWLTYDKGRFWNEYSKFRKYAQQNVVNAKKAESVDSDKAMSFYEKAFQNYRNAENLLLEHKCMLWRSMINKYWLKASHFWWWLLITLILSITSTIISIYW